MRLLEDGQDTHLDVVPQQGCYGRVLAREGDELEIDLSRTLEELAYKVLQTSERAAAVGQRAGTFLNVSHQLRQRLYRAALY